jgi:enterochelin esterase-like enzyme
MKYTISDLTFIRKFSCLFFLMLFFFTASGNGGEVTIIDSRHYSHIMGEIRNYRIFLPPGYSGNAEKRYPVIYFFHGWSQRYFGSSDSYADYDKGDENNGDNIANFVASHEVIVVKADGYNRSNDEEYYVRPYNVSPVETYRQFPVYFPELVEHIDSHYKTIANREHRGISGLSMGGFMTFWIGGKYPHLLSAAGNFCGSPEFMVGPKDFPVEYRHLDMYKNYEGMKIRLNFGDKDFIRGYHQDLNKVWLQVMDNYEYQVYNAGHSTCGMSDMFSFILDSFKNPPARPSSWNHIDVYPDFSVWDYQVTSDRTIPGFTILENVDERGFRCSVREFLPDGALLTTVNLTITTSPIYEKNQTYIVNDLDLNSSKVSQKIITSDQNGRLLFAVNGGSHEIGINKKTDIPNIGIASIEIQNMPWATHDKEVTLGLKLFNKGLSTGDNISATITSTRTTAKVTQANSSFGNIKVNETQSGDKLFKVRVLADSVEIEKFKVSIKDKYGNEWVDFFEIPIKKELPEIKDFEIADGKVFTVARAGVDSETVMLGTGNGDGIANPGESIVILVKDQDKLWRTDLSFSDPYLNPNGINVRKSDNWTSFDYVGASAKYDVPLIASDCPENHQLEFFAEYWLPEYPLHFIKQGVIKLEVIGKDQTPPKLDWVKITGDNILQAKIMDGSKISGVKAKLIPKNDPAKFFDVELKDNGLGGDRVENDQIFSTIIPQQKFGIYRVVIEAKDTFGNLMVEEYTEEFVVH